MKFEDIVVKMKYVETSTTMMRRNGETGIHLVQHNTTHYITNNKLIEPNRDSSAIASKQNEKHTKND